MEIYKLLINLVENPFAAKIYSQIRDYYEKKGKTKESAAFQYLLAEKYANDPSFSSKSREDNCSNT